MIDNDFMKYMWDLYLTTIVTMFDNFYNIHECNG